MKSTSSPKSSTQVLINIGMALLFIVSGLAVLLTFGNRTTLSCDRSQPPVGVCTLRTENILSRKEKPIAVNQLLGAYVDETIGKDGPTYRVVLQTTSGDIPFTNIYSSGSADKQQMADQINKFLQYSSLSTLLVKSDSRIVMVIFSGVFVGVGGLQLISAIRKLIEPGPESGNGAV